MALITCKECGAAVSSAAKACTKCGAPVPKAKVWPWVLGVPAAGVLLMLAYGATIPEYVHHARKLREVCEQLAGPLRRGECDAMHAKALREGQETEEILSGKRQPAPPTGNPVPLTPEQKKRSECADAIEVSKAEYEAHMKRGEFKAAADGMRKCSKLLQDPFLENLVAEAEAKSARKQPK